MYRSYTRGGLQCTALGPAVGHKTLLLTPAVGYFQPLLYPWWEFIIGFIPLLPHGSRYMLITSL
jgi:hypothetical protein